MVWLGTPLYKQWMSHFVAQTPHAQQKWLISLWRLHGTLLLSLCKRLTDWKPRDARKTLTENGLTKKSTWKGSLEKHRPRQTRWCKGGYCQVQYEIWWVLHRNSISSIEQQISSVRLKKANDHFTSEIIIDYSLYEIKNKHHSHYFLQWSYIQMLHFLCPSV